MTAPKKDFRCASVAVLGRPNAGKSTLLNALLGTAVSGTSKRPQTTRQNIRGVIQFHNPEKEWTGQLVIVDTPGLNFKKGLLERSMHMAVEDTLAKVDLVVWVADARTWKKDLKDVELEQPGADRIASWLTNQLKALRPESKWILVLSKVDLVAKNDLLPLIQKSLEVLPQFSDVVPIAAELGLGAKGSNLNALLEILKDTAPESDPMYGEETWTDLNDRQLIQNLVREAIFRQGREEVPYETDCSIESYVEPEGVKKMAEVHANIWVTKDSIKPILVGKAGSRIKEIGHSVRKRYKEITGHDLVLKLFVKVVEKWNLRAAHLQELGYVLK